jgi:hypothetical protein
MALRIAIIGAAEVGARSGKTKSSAEGASDKPEPRH